MKNPGKKNRATGFRSYGALLRYRQSLETESMSTETRIRVNTRDLADTLNPKRLLQELSTEIQSVREIFLTLFQFGKGIFRKKKKKKPKKNQAE